MTGGHAGALYTRNPSTNACQDGSSLLSTYDAFAVGPELPSSAFVLGTLASLRASVAFFFRIPGAVLHLDVRRRTFEMDIGEVETSLLALSESCADRERGQPLLHPLPGLLECVPAVEELRLFARVGIPILLVAIVLVAIFTLDRHAPCRVARDVLAIDGPVEEATQKVQAVLPRLELDRLRRVTSLRGDLRLQVFEPVENIAPCDRLRGLG